MAISITDLEDPRIAPFTTLRARRTIQKEGGLKVEREPFVVAEGEKNVRSLLASGLPLLAFFAEPQHHTALNSLLDRSGLSSDLRYVADQQLLQKVVGYRMHQGVMALTRAPDQTPVAELSSPVLLLNGLANAENVGAAIRNAVAFGVRSVVIDGQTASPFLRRSIKVSMGAVFQVRWTRVTSLVETLKTLRQRGVTTVAADLCDDAVPLCDFHFPSDYALTLGSEGAGIDQRVREEVDRLVAIPIDSSIDSLNVAAASAIFFYRASASR